MHLLDTTHCNRPIQWALGLILCHSLSCPLEEIFVHGCPVALSVTKANTWAQGSFGGWIETRACMSHESLCLEKGGKSNLCHNVNEPWRHRAKGYKLATKDKHDLISLTTANMAGSLLHTVLRAIKIMETEGIVVMSRCGQRDDVELQFNRCRVSELGCKLNECFQWISLKINEMASFMLRALRRKGIS